MSNYLSRLAVRSAGITPQPHQPGNAVRQPGNPVFDPFETVAPDSPTPGAATGLQAAPSQGLPLPGALRPNMPGALDMSQPKAAPADLIGFVERVDSAAPVMPVEAANLSRKSDVRQPDEGDLVRETQRITPLPDEARPAPIIQAQMPVARPGEIRVHSGRMDDLWTAEKQAQALQAMQERRQSQVLAEGASNSVQARSVELQPPPEAARPMFPTARQEVRPSAPPPPASQPEPAAPHLVIGSLRVEVLPASPQPQTLTVINQSARAPLAPPAAPSGLRFGLGQM